MPDNREAIMAQLEEIALTVEGVQRVVRNTFAISDNRFPAVAILEGDEEADEGDDQRRGNLAGRRVHMTPHLVVCGGETPEALGPVMNLIRQRLIAAVLADETLRDLTLNKSGVRYVGIKSALALGEQMTAHMAVVFRITYTLQPSQL